MPDTEKELFESAFEDEPRVAQVQIVEPEGEAVEQEQAKPEERQRDEKGRFAPKAEAEPEKQPEDAKPQEQQPAEPQQPAAQPEKQEHRVPLPELLTEREKRQAAERRAEEVAQNLQQVQFQLRQMQAQFQQLQQPNTPKPNLFDNPEEWEQRQTQSVQTLLQQQQLQFSEQFARLKYGDETYEAAERAAQQVMASGQMDPTLMSVRNAPNPGIALVEWHKRKQTLERLGNLDPDKYVEQEIEKRLNDPAFLAKAVERARATAQAQPGPATQKPATIPSLNRQTSAAPTNPDSDDESDGALLKSALRR